jgi:3-dehydroquinate dehydratase II
MKKILVIHGPNLDLLGTREKDVYGTITLDEINAALTASAKEEGVALEFLQSNHEGDIVDKIGQAKKEGFDAILINPAAYTHTSVAIRDAVAAIDIPTVEVHLSNIYAREEFRHTSLIAPVAAGQVSGFGPESYVLGLKAVVSLLK